ncbi:MAG: hypothetical protein LBD02_03995 [Christensenellaceae bacterium]|nr:hypothetical protein [Christensenellaceae bacterium]
MPFEGEYVDFAADALLTDNHDQLAAAHLCPGSDERFIAPKPSVFGDSIARYCPEYTKASPSPMRQRPPKDREREGEGLLLVDDGPAIDESGADLPVSGEAARLERAAGGLGAAVAGGQDEE